MFGSARAPGSLEARSRPTRRMGRNTRQIAWMSPLAAMRPRNVSCDREIVPSATCWQPLTSRRGSEPGAILCPLAPTSCGSRASDRLHPPEGRRRTPNSTWSSFVRERWSHGTSRRSSAMTTCRPSGCRHAPWRAGHAWNCCGGPSSLASPASFRRTRSSPLKSPSSKRGAPVDRCGSRTARSNLRTVSAPATVAVPSGRSLARARLDTRHDLRCRGWLQ